VSVFIDFEGQSIAWLPKDRLGRPPFLPLLYRN
jgi:hypothetical protein